MRRSLAMFKSLININFYTLIFIVIFKSQLAFAIKALEAEVTVSPVGDFIAAVDKVSGYIILKEKKYIGENVKFNLKNLKTGMSLRDEHALKHLNVEQFPFAELVKGEGIDGKGKATIKIHGKEKEIEGTFIVQESYLEANFKILLSDFGIEGINYKGAGVDDEVKVTVRVPIKK